MGHVDLLLLSVALHDEPLALRLLLCHLLALDRKRKVAPKRQVGLQLRGWGSGGGWQCSGHPGSLHRFINLTIPKQPNININNKSQITKAEPPQPTIRHRIRPRPK